jgi:hypothetical protein
MAIEPKQKQAADDWWQGHGKDLVCPACNNPAPWKGLEVLKLNTTNAPFGFLFLTLICDCGYSIFVKSPHQT